MRLLPPRVASPAAALALAATAALATLGGPRPAGATPAARTVAAPATAAPTWPVGHQGRWLTDADGRVLLLHGVNFVSKQPGATPAADGLGPEDAAWLADNGLGVVRLGTTAASIMPSPGVIDSAYVASFAATAKMLTDHGLLVLVDLHQDGWGPSLGDDGFPDWMTLTHGATNTHTTFPLYYLTNPAIQTAFQSFWGNEAGPGGVTLQDRTAAIWSALSAAVGSDPGIIGYDLINEPWPGTTWQDCASGTGGCPAQDATIDAYATRMTAAIRANDPTHLLLPEPWVLFNFGGAPTNIGLAGGDPASGMSWHLYPLDAAHEAPTVAYAVDWATKTGGALLNTEFGATNDPVVIDRQVALLDDALMPWLWWAYNGHVVDDPHVDPTGSNLDLPAVNELVRAHALAVAGIPQSNHDDVAARTLTFSYRTARAGGGSFACGAVTSFETPARAYPDGYHVTVTGGVVTSAPGAAQLTVVARPGASTVSVTIAPGGSTAPTSATAVCAGATTTTVSPAGGGTTTTVAAAPAEAVQGEPTYTG